MYTYKLNFCFLYNSCLLRTIIPDAIEKNFLLQHNNSKYTQKGNSILMVGLPVTTFCVLDIKTEDSIIQVL